MLAAHSHGQDIPTTDGQTADDCGQFGYLCPRAPEAPFTNQTLPAITALVADMVEQGDEDAGNHSSLSPVMTYLGQFIDHDITATSARPGGPALPAIDDPDLSPLPRADVAGHFINLRTGQFDLDSLYGHEGPTGNDALDKLNRLMRFPGDRAKMWLGTYGAVGGRLPFPADPGGDLLRLGRLMRDGDFTEADIDALPDEHKKLMRRDDGSLNLARAIIGDARNDENLFIAQLHLAFLRFHNRMVDAWPHGRSAGDEQRVFEWARAEVRKTYQWLVLNVYLPSICDPQVVREILADGPTLYDAFLADCDWTPGDPLPMPLEFATACFRFGHSMVRGTYDWNVNFPQATFLRMFQFTGGATPPMLSTGDRLPENWGADWDRLVHPVSRFPERSTRRIDTVLADRLSDMVNEPAGNINRNLLSRNLRRGVLHNLPTAQALIACLSDLGLRVRPLTKAQIARGETAGEVTAGKFDTDTPLWFYTLKEAEVMHRGQRLGPLGSHVVAGTMIGLIQRGQDSVWDEPGSNEGRWHPVDGPRVSGQLVDSLPALMRAALLMHNPDT